MVRLISISTMVPHLLVVFIVGCSSNISDDDETLMDDDSANAGDDDDDTELSGCDEVLDQYGESSIGLQSVACESGYVLFGDLLCGDDLSQPSGEPATFILDSQAALDEFLTDSFGDENPLFPCTVNFLEYFVAGTSYYTVTQNCSTVEICDVLQSDSSTILPVFFYKCENGTQDVTFVYHLVQIARSGHQLRFDVYKNTYGESDW